MHDLGATEWAVLGDDAELRDPIVFVVAGPRVRRVRGGIDVGGESVRSHGIGDGMQRGAEAVLGFRRVAHRGRHGLAILGPDFLGEGFGLFSGQKGERTLEQGHQHGVMANENLRAELRFGGAVALGRSAGAAAGAPGEDDLGVPACGELVEVVAGHVHMQAEAFGHLSGGSSAWNLVQVQEDVAAGGVSEGGGDSADGRGELGGIQGRSLHPTILPIAVGEILKGLRMPLTEAAVLDALRPVQDPELHRSIVDLGMVRAVSIEDRAVVVDVDLTIAGCPLRNEIDQRVSGALAALGATSVQVRFGVMNDEQRAKVRQLVHGDPAATAGSQNSHGHAEGRVIPFADPSNRTRCLLIASGKGGVGKSSITANLAIALARRGRKVAVIDADVWGFSIPRMLGVDRSPVVIDSMLIPPEVHGVRCISMGFFVEENQPVIWRGPMLHKALEQFLTDVFWDDPDYLLVDLPPGTGDISLSLSQFLPRSEVLVVTTPQPASQKVAQRVGFMAHKVNLQVRGVIENMSWFMGDDGKRYELFGAGGGEELSKVLEVPLIGRVPFVPELRIGSDIGQPIMAVDPDSEAALAIDAIAGQLETVLRPTRIYSSALKLN